MSGVWSMLGATYTRRALGSEVIEFDDAGADDDAAEKGPEAIEYTVTLVCMVITLMLLVKLVDRRLPVRAARQLGRAVMAWRGVAF
jgi:hypothetical protein